jgi:hypothetical protein
MFARHYLRNLGWFLFLWLLRCFSSPGLPPSPYIFRSGYPCGWVSPFRHVRIKAYLPAPRTFSQAITSFIACNRQGIHHMHLFTWPYNVKTWTLFNSNPAVHETPAIGFLKQLRHYSKVIKIMTGLLFQLQSSLIKLNIQLNTTKRNDFRFCNQSILSD